MEFRQNIQGTMTGLNCTVGLAMGVTQVGYLGKQVVKMLLKAVKYIF